jgi:hypothetical protein
MKDIPIPDCLKDLSELERAEACLAVAMSMWIDAIMKMKAQADE